MKFKTKLISFIVLFCTTAIQIRAQEVIPVSGGDFDNANGSVSYSIGLSIFNYSRDNDYTVTAGALQPYEVSITTAIEDQNDIQLKYTIYPNPTSDYLTLSHENTSYQKLNYILTDQNGRILIKEEIADSETKIDMKSFIPAQYYIIIRDTEKTLKTFKIIKN